MVFKKIGFVGLGIMGKPMTLNLLKARYNLIVFDIDCERCVELEKVGAEIASSNREIAAESDLIITMLPKSLHVTEAMFGPNGIVEGIRSGSILVDMSFIAPAVTQEVPARLAEKQVEMLDAPVSGGEPKAIDGSLAVGW